MNIGQLEALIALALSQGLTSLDPFFVINGASDLPANGIVQANAGNELIQLGGYQAASGSAVPVPPVRGLYVGLGS